MKNKNLKGFTLIELLIVIGIIAILAGIVLVAVNPAEQFGKANDAERKSEIGTLLSAIYQYQTSPTARGALPQCTDVDTATLINIPDCDDAALAGSAWDGAMELGTGAGQLNCATTLVPSYLREIPVDPSGDPDYVLGTTGSGYWVCLEDGTVPRIYVISSGVEVFNTDGGCMYPGDPANFATEPEIDGVAPLATTPVMCVSG